MDASGTIGGTVYGISATATVAYSQEKSVKQAVELSKQASGSVAVTEVSCSTSKVQMNKITFHPQFLSELASASTIDDFVALINKYGTHYYKRATLGGKLKQVTTLEKSYFEKKSNSDIKAHTERSFGGSVSYKAFSVNGDYSDTSDSQTTSSSREEHEQNSYSSTVITYGGPPGSFGPAYSEAPSNFGDWASSVDLLPIPIDYELESISTLLPSTWKAKPSNSTSNQTVRQMWIEAEQHVIDQTDVLTDERKRNFFIQM
jgi:hypothetical protein